MQFITRVKVTVYVYQSTKQLIANHGIFDLIKIQIQCCFSQTRIKQIISQPLMKTDNSFIDQEFHCLNTENDYDALNTNRDPKSSHKPHTLSTAKVPFPLISPP